MFCSKESQLAKLGISGSSVHTFTKISVGSQTDLEALLAYVKSLQAKLEESAHEEEAPEASILSIESQTQTQETERIAESSQVTPSLSDMLVDAVVDSGNSTPTNVNNQRQVRERDRDRALLSLISVLET